MAGAEPVWKSPSESGSAWGLRGQLDAPADVRVPPGLRFGAHERAHGRAYEQAHGRARERGLVRAAETMAEPRPPNRPWSPRRSPRRSRRAGSLGMRASELRRLQLDEYDAYSRARGAIASTGEALPRREGYRTHTSESFLMQAYLAWGYMGTLGAVAALNNNPQVVIRQLQSISGNQSAIIRNNPSATIQPQQSATIHPQQSATIRNYPQQSNRNNSSAIIHPQQIRPQQSI